MLITPPPLISVIMPVRNGERFLHEAIASILGQTYQDFELIIIDDYSSDRTPEIIQSFEDPRISVIKPEAHGHLTSALNSARGVVRGDLIARMDADDLAHPDRFEKQVLFMQDNPAVGILGTQVRQVDVNGNEVSASHTAKPLLHDDVVVALFFGCPLWHPTVMLRKGVMDALGWYGSSVIEGREQFSGEDYDLWSRAIHDTKIENLPDVLLDYRLHDSNLSLAASGRKDHCLNTVLVLRQLIRNELDIKADLGVCAAMLKCSPSDFPSGTVANAMPKDMFKLVKPILKYADSAGFSKNGKAMLRNRLSNVLEALLWQRGYNIFRECVCLCLVEPVIGPSVLFSSLKRFL
jgi:glycosyltransferase involved in cell wall biosynthesis